ncbi:MAG: hypothetical protein JW715_09540 [Sedimentisphaerales bacterium]|nr:hypothetical protein [Sedimentisphaerales bacterium]
MLKRTHLITIFVISVFFIVSGGVTPVEAKTIYVDDDAVGVNDGSSWTDAFNYLQDALAAASDGDEIHVAQGVYTPDSNSAIPDGTGNREATFQLIGDISLKGSYAGYGVRNPYARDTELTPTILSGDLYGNNDSNVLEESSREENSYHVVTCSSNAILDGLIITGGSASGTGGRYGDMHNFGGGIYNDGGSPTIINCTFIKNYAALGGGGIVSYSGNPNLTNCTFNGNVVLGDGGGFCNYQGSLTLTNCIFINNSTQGSRSGSGDGGGIWSYEGSLVLTNCTFIENSAHAGGGLYNETSNPTLTNCLFRGNSVSDRGGSMYSANKSLSGDSPILKNCLFNGNNAGFRGGAVYNLSCEPVLNNCTFAQNWAGEGNAIYCKSEDERNTITLTNCILWDYGTEIETWDNNLSVINVSYSNIRGGWEGEGNIDEDPLFVDQLGPDYRFRTEDDNLRLVPVSPCVDTGQSDYVAGASETDLDGNPRIIRSRVDMGAYEFQGDVYVDDDAPRDMLQRPDFPIDHLEENGTQELPFDTIQEAIDIAKDGYTVLVKPGLYGKIDFMGKAITVTGTEGVPVIAAYYSGRGGKIPEDAVTFHTGEGRSSVFKNFIIKESSIAISLNFSSPKIHNVTIVNNAFGIAAYDNSSPDIRNCILWNNTDGDLFQCEAKYSCIETGIAGEGNINVNPLFVDAANGDYHLKSEGWCWNTIGQSWTWDDVTSACIDAGDPCSPLGDEPMKVPRDPNNLYGENLYINMGAYGGTCQASMPPLNWGSPEEEDNTAPTPNPAQWATDGAPREVNGGDGEFDYWVWMKAATATDASGFVEYFFECTTESGFNSGWQSSPEYSVPVGRSGQGLRFRVKVRDSYNNETAFSDERTAH